LFLLPAVVAAQTAPAAGQPEQQQQQRTDAHTDRDLVMRADRLIGQPVTDAADERIGRIDDLALNLGENKIAYAIVSRGGLFGIGAETVAVPWEQIRPDPVQARVRIDRQQLDQARHIDTAGPWPGDLRIQDQQRQDDRPVGTAGEVGTAGRDARDPGHQVGPNVISTDRLIGTEVRNQQGERLGHIDDVTLGEDGSIKYAVIAHGGFLGIGHNYVAVPWDRMDVDPRQERVMLNVSTQELQGARPFQHGERWPAEVDWPFGTP
jgi:sporulation protein YlmC with PRC-barrel domain